MRRDDVKFLEARVVDEGICLAIEKKWDNIEIETDAQSVIKQLRNEGYYWWTATLVSNILHTTG